MPLPAAEPPPPSAARAAYRHLAPLRSFLVGVVLLALLPLLALVGWQIAQHVSAEQSQIEGDLARSVAAFAAAVDMELLASEDALAVLTRTDAMRAGPREFERAVRARPPARRDWQGVFLVDTHGRLLVEVDYGAADTPLAGALPGLLRSVLAGGQPAVSGLVGAADAPALVLIAVPVVRDGVAVGMLGARLPASAWQRLAGAASRPPGAYALLHDGQRRVVATSLPGPLPAGSVAPPVPATGPERRPFGVQRSVGADGNPAYAAWQAVPAAAGWGVQIVAPAEPIDEAQRRAYALAVAAGIGSLLLGAALAGIAARRITGPLRALAAHGPAGLEEPVVVREVAMLRDALDAAAARDAASRRALEDDIAQRRRVENDLLEAQAVLREEQRLNELTQEAGRVGFCQYRYSTGELLWSSGHCKLFGIDALEAGGLEGWFGRIAPGDRDRVQQTLAATLEAGDETALLDYGALQPDGGERWLSTRLQVEYDRAGEPLQLAGVSVDMTDQRETQLQREELTRREVAARRDAEAASRAKDEFLAMLGHELRNPLGAISAAADVLQAAQPGSEGAKEALEIVGRQTRNLARLVHDLLDVGRAITGRLALTRLPVDLAAMLERVRGTLQVTGGSATHDLRLDAQEAWVSGDAVRLEQVLAGLLGNALQYTPPGGQVDVGTRRDGDWAVIEVRDTGIGIAPALLPRVFDLFVQGERPLDRRAGGLGIGLTLVRSVVELHGGTVEASSSPAGSCFTVRLPAIEPPARQPDTALPESRRRRVLVIDDNADVLAALRGKLELDGHTVSAASDGVDGLDRLLSQQPEVALVDIGLPGLTGYELARHARAAGYGGRLVALSGYGQERDVRDALVAGFDAYLVKPVEREQLRASLSAT